MPLLRLGQYHDAYKILTKASLLISPENIYDTATIYINLCATHSKLNNHYKAIESAKKAITLVLQHIQHIQVMQNNSGSWI